METHDTEQLIWRGHPSARSSWPFFLKWGIAALLPVAFAGIFRANGRTMGMDYWKWLLVSGGLLAVVVVIDVFRRAAIDYVVTTHRIRIRRGILSRREQSAPVARVQNVGSREGLLERILGIGSVDFETAGTEQATATFRFAGVAKPRELMQRFEMYLTELRKGPPGE